MSGRHCVCQNEGVFVFPCSGGSDVGELSDRVARKIVKSGKSRMFCLAGLGAKIEGMIETAKTAKKMVAIDGCQMLCAKKVLEQAGFEPISFNLKTMGFEKGKTTVDDATIEKAFSMITGR